MRAGGPWPCIVQGLRLQRNKLSLSALQALRIHRLDGGFKYFLFSPLTLGKRSNLTSILFKGVGSTITSGDRNPFPPPKQSPLGGCVHIFMAFFGDLWGKKRGLNAQKVNLWQNSSPPLLHKYPLSLSGISSHQKILPFLCLSENESPCPGCHSVSFGFFSP